MTLWSWRQHYKYRPGYNIMLYAFSANVTASCFTSRKCSSESPSGWRWSLWIVRHHLVHVLCIDRTQRQHWNVKPSIPTEQTAVSAKTIILWQQSLKVPKFQLLFTANKPYLRSAKMHPNYTVSQIITKSREHIICRQMLVMSLLLVAEYGNPFSDRNVKNCSWRRAQEIFHWRIVRMKVLWPSLTVNNTMVIFKMNIILKK